MGSSNSAKSYSVTVCIQCTYKILSGIRFSSIFESTIPRVSTAKKMLRSPPVKKFQKPCRVFSARRGLVAGVDRDLFLINICTFKLLSLNAAEEK